MEVLQSLQLLLPYAILPREVPLLLLVWVTREVVLNLDALPQQVGLSGFVNSMQGTKASLHSPFPSFFSGKALRRL